MNQVTGNETVKLHYTGKLNDGQVFDSSLQREPLEVTLGEGRLIPGFEKGLVNMKVNEKKTITIPKEEAYGDVQKELLDRKSTRLNSSHVRISYAVFCLKKKKNKKTTCPSKKNYN